MKWLLFAICSFSQLVCFGQAPEQKTPTVSVYSLGQRLSEMRASLQHIDSLNEEKLDQYRIETLDIISQLKTIQEDAQNKVNQNQDRIVDLEGEVLLLHGEQKIQVEHAISNLQQRIASDQKRIERLDQVVQKGELLLVEIHQASLKLVVVELQEKAPPFYLLSTWTTDLSALFQGVQLAIISLTELGKDVIIRLETVWGAGFLVTSLLVVIFLWTFVRKKVLKSYHERFSKYTASEITPSLIFSKIAHRVWAKGIFPSIPLLIIYAMIHISSGNPNTKLAAEVTLIAIATFMILHTLVLGILSRKDPKWRVLVFNEGLVDGLALHLRVFLILIALVLWFYALDRLIDVPEGCTQMVRFILGVILSWNIVSLLRKRYWYPLEAKFAFLTKSLRIVAAIIAIINPLLIFVGYMNLANYFLINLLLSGITLLGLYSAHYFISYEIVRIFDLTHPIGSFFALEDRSRKITIYWISGILGLILWGFGAVILLLIWGVNNELILDTFSMLFFGKDVGEYHFGILNTLFAIGITATLMGATRLFQRILEVKVFPYTSISKGLSHALKKGIGYLGYAIAIIVGISIFGFKLSSLGYVLGGLSVGIGLGLQPIITNFVSGIILLMERPIRIGDVVDVDGDTGTITNISVRATEVRTFDRCSVLIPNSEMITKTVRNWTHENPIKRMKIQVSVSYGADVELAKKLLIELAKRHEHVLQNPPPYVYLNRFGESGIDLELGIYIDEIQNSLVTASDIRMGIRSDFKEHNIEIPFNRIEVSIIKSE